MTAPRLARLPRRNAISPRLYFSASLAPCVTPRPPLEASHGGGELCATRALLPARAQIGLFYFGQPFDGHFEGRYGARHLILLPLRYKRYFAFASTSDVYIYRRYQPDDDAASFT